MLISTRESVGDGCHDRVMTTTTITPDQDVMTQVVGRVVHSTHA